MSNEYIAKMRSVYDNLKIRIVPFEKADDNLLTSIRANIKEYRVKYRELKKLKDKSYYQMKEEANTLFPLFIKEFKNHLENICKATESKVTVLRVNGDFQRYMVEFNEESPELQSTFIQESLISYREAMSYCDELPSDNYTKLATTLNFIVLLADEMRAIDDAIELATKTLESIKNKELDESRKEIQKIIEENLNYFKENREKYLTDIKLA